MHPFSFIFCFVKRDPSLSRKIQRNQSMGTWNQKNFHLQRQVVGIKTDRRDELPKFVGSFHDNSFEEKKNLRTIFSRSNESIRWRFISETGRMKAPTRFLLSLTTNEESRLIIPLSSELPTEIDFVHVEDNSDLIDQCPSRLTLFTSRPALFLTRSNGLQTVSLMNYFQDEKMYRNAIELIWFDLLLDVATDVKS